MNSNAGCFVWFENVTNDPTAAIDFYTHVVGWKTEAFGEGYTMWVGSEGPLGGVVELPRKSAEMGAPPHWVGTVEVADIDAVITRLKQLGGVVHNGPEAVAQVGRYAIVGDPQGAGFGLLQAERPMSLHDTSNDGEFCWKELMTSDQAGAFAFYSELFGWRKLDEMDIGELGTYLLFGVGDQPLGGMMKVPPNTQMPPSWLYYVQTSDLDAALGRAKQRGATVMYGPMEVPGGARVAQLMDPQGAMFALHEEPVS